MSFWDSLGGTLDKVSTSVEGIFDKGVDIYTAKTKFDTAKANQKTARTVAELQAQASLERAKSEATRGNNYGTEMSAPLIDQPQSAPIVINKQTEPQGFGLGTLIIIAVFAYGVSHA